MDLGTPRISMREISACSAEIYPECVHLVSYSYTGALAWTETLTPGRRAANHKHNITPKADASTRNENGIRIRNEHFCIENARRIRHSVRVSGTRTFKVRQDWRGDKGTITTKRHTPRILTASTSLNEKLISHRELQTINFPNNI